MRKRMASLVSVALLTSAGLLGPSHGRADAATLFVDMLPGGAIDVTLTKAPGEAFDVSVLVSNAPSFAGFQFELGFDPAIVTATSLTSAQIFGLDTFELMKSLTPGLVRFAEVTLAPSGLNIVAAAALATIQFSVIGTGVTAFDIQNGLLSDAAGGPITPLVQQDGTLTSRVMPAIPEPSSVVLLVTGLAGVLRRGRHMRM